MRPFPVILLLLMVMTACVPAQPTQTAVQATALAIVYTAIAQTQTAQPTNTPLPPTITPTATIVYPTPSPYPTEAPITFAITPDATQVERWEEYQSIIARELISSPHFPLQSILCEWEILGRSGSEIYLWAVCATPSYRESKPVVIYLDTDGSIQQVNSPTMYVDTTESEIKKLFPPDIEAKIVSYDPYKKSVEYTSHIEWRRSHPEVPPLIIQSAVPFVTPTFTPASPPILTPNASQIERWREYQTALADAILIEYNYYPEDALCEWDILGHSGREVYVWAVCQNKFSDASIPAIIHLVSDESISAVEIPRTGSDYDSDVQGIFPKDIQAKFLSYYPYPFGRVWEMLKHIEWRQKHIEEPPLIILSATTVVPTP